METQIPWEATRLRYDAPAAALSHESDANGSGPFGLDQRAAGCETDPLGTSQDVAILVVSCDAYHDLWAPFFHCFFKYFPDCPYPVFLGSNTITHPDSRISALLVGPDIDYSSNLMKMLQAIDHDWVILWIDDRFIARHVDAARLARCIQQVQEQRGVYAKLVANNPFARKANASQVLGEIPPGEPYRVSITVGLWQKRALEQLLHHGESAWELEYAGSARSNGISGKFFSVAAQFRHDPPIVDEHIIIKGQVARPARRFLEQEGLLRACQSHRQIQTWRSALYVRLFVGFRLAMLRVGLDDAFKPIWRAVRYLKGLRK
jgi:hypothetical protein